MGEAKRRGNYFTRKAKAIAWREKLLGKRVRSSVYGEGVVHEVKPYGVTIRFCRGGRTNDVRFPLSAVMGSVGA